MDKDKYLDKIADISVDNINSNVKTVRSCDNLKNGWSQFDSKLHVYDWLHDFPEMQQLTNLVEVQFKNTRKGFYINSNNLELQKGDTVAVEATPGHDIGTITLTGKLVELQMRKKNISADNNDSIKRIYRIARPADLEKYEQAKAREIPTMIRAREIAENLGLQMKISDVEFQGDGSKAIFYYIADERVDFRQLIKEYAAEFRIKIEMKQIGSRQEAALVGGIGPCGRELCCSRWMTNFVSVSTAATRYQDISFNPQKLAGLCGKLKCCMNYEVDAYIEAYRELPSREIVLQTQNSDYFHFKTDILARKITYSTDKNLAVNLVTISKDRAFEIIELNKKGKKPALLEESQDQISNSKSQSEYIGDVLEDNSLTRFDGKKKETKSRNRRNRNNRQEGGNKNRRKRRSGNNEN